MSTDPDKTPMWVQALLDANLTPTEFRVWSYLAWRQGKNGSAWPSIHRIATDLRLSDSTVHRAIDTLVRRGRLTKKLPKISGRTHTNRYQINGITHDRVSSEKGVTGGRKRVSPMTAKHKTMNTTQSLDHWANGQGGFDRFWNAYPRKVKKAHAQRIWQKINPTSEMVEQIVAAVERHRESEQWQRDDGRYTPHPATWLNDKRWTDEGDGEPCAAEVPPFVCPDGRTPRKRVLAGLEGNYESD